MALILTKKVVYHGQSKGITIPPKYIKNKKEVTIILLSDDETKELIKKAIDDFVVREN